MKRAKLMFAANDSDADMLYATHFRAPDPFAFIDMAGHTIILLSDLEVDRGRKTAAVDEVVLWSFVERQVQGKDSAKPAAAKVLAAFLRSREVKRVEVSAAFPLGLAQALKKQGVRIRPASGPFWPARAVKTAGEIRALTAAARVAEAGLARAMEVLRATTIRKDGRLFWGRRVLTSELLRLEMETAVVRAGGEARGDTIVAGGEQACDPHERGHGPLRANELLILDIFPRAAGSGYFGDITRTVVRGQASEAQRRLWEICRQGQEQALQAVAPGRNGGEIHDQVKAFFAESGYPTEIRDGRWQGFFHGTGHGLGLEIHEEPRFAATTFRRGQVFTVEPGIYLPGVGGVRHEDVIVVIPGGSRQLTQFPKELEI